MPDPPSKKITCRRIKSYSHTHFTAFTLYPQKLQFILVEITAIPPQEHSMQVMPGSLFKEVAAHEADLQNKYQKNVRQTLCSSREKIIPQAQRQIFYSVEDEKAS